MPKVKDYRYLVILILAIVAPLMLKSTFHRDHLVLTLIFTILALGLDIIIGGMGQYSFGHHAFFGIGAYASAILSLKLGPGSVWLGFLLAAISSGIVGFVIGFICLRTLRKINLAIVTFGFAYVFLAIASNWWSVTGGPRGLLWIPHPSISIPFLPSVVFDSELSYYYLALAFLILTMYFVSRLWQSRFGRAVQSLRENEDLASSIGISPFRYYVLAFTLAAAITGLGGALYAHYLTVVNPQLFGIYYIFILLVMVIAGGSGTLWGPLIGAFIVVWVPDLLPVAEEYRLLIFGVVLYLFVIFLPRGIYPSLISLWGSFTKFISKHWSKKGGVL